MAGLDDALGLAASGADELVGIEGRLASLGLKAARTLDREQPELVYGRIELPMVQGDGYSGFELIPSKQAQAVELNLLPFVSNVGTFLADRGVLPDNAWLTLAVDAAADFGNLASLGTATLLTKAGTRARVISKVLSVDGIVPKGKTGADVVDALTNVIEMAGKLGNAQEGVVRAAKAGDKAAVKELFDAALKSGKPTDEAAKLVADLRRDRKVLAEMLDDADALRKEGALKPKDFLQETRVERLKAGQVNPLLGIAAPGNPIRDPLGTVRRMVGWTYRDELIAMPGSHAVAEALDKFLPLKSVEKLGADVGMKFGATAAAGAKMAERIATDGGATASDLQRMNIKLGMLLGLPNERALRLVSQGDVGEAQAKALVRAMNPGKEKISEKDMEWATNLLAKKASERYADLDAAIKARRTQRLAEAESQITELWRAREAADEIIELDVADTRQLWELSQLTNIVDDAAGIGNALRGRVGLGNMMAANYSAISREVIAKHYPDIDVRDQVNAVLKHLAEHPDMVQVRDGRMFLKPGMDEAAVKEGSPLLWRSLYRDPRGESLRGLLTQQGLAPEVAQVTALWSDVLQQGRRTLQGEGVLLGFIGNYFPRAFTPNAKFFKHFGVNEQSYAQFFEAGYQDDRFVDILFGGKEGRKAILDKMGTGKLSLQEQRKFSEEMMIRLEDAGMGVYERDSVTLMGEYLGAANQAILSNRLFLDLPRIAPKVNGVGIVVESLADAPGAMQKDYVGFTGGGRYLGEIDDPARAVEGVAPDVVREQVRVMGPTKGVEKRARAEVAKELAGRTDIDGFSVRDKKTLALVPIKAEWVTKQSVPENIVGWKELKARIQANVEGRAKTVAPPPPRPHSAADKRAVQIWVHKDHAGHIADAFRMFRKGHSSDALRTIERWNSGLKAVVLAGDLFHTNALSMMSVVGDPMSALKALFEDRATAGAVLEGAWGAAAKGRPAEALMRMTQNAIVSTGAGAAIGAAAAPALGADEANEYLGFSMAGALWGLSIGAAIRNGKMSRRKMLNPAYAEELRIAGLTGWTGRPDDRSLGVAQRYMRRWREEAIRSGKGVQADLLGSGIHALDAYEDMLWGTLHNGGKLHYFALGYNKFLPKMQESTAWKKAEAAGDVKAMQNMKLQLGREVMQQANNVFGAQAYSNLFAKPEFKHAMQLLIISPDWTSSRLQLTASFLANMGPVKSALTGAGLGTAVELVQSGFDPNEMDGRGAAYGAIFGGWGGAWSRNVVKRMGTKGDVYATLGRRYAVTALAAGYATFNLLNYALNGRWMWENGEDHKLAVDLPNGMYLSPGKPFAEAYEFAGIKDPRLYSLPVGGRLVTKLAPIPNLARAVINDGPFGGTIIQAGDSPIEVAYQLGSIALSSVTPIGLGNTFEAGARLLAGQSRGESDLVQAAAGIAGLPIKGRAGGPTSFEALNASQLQTMMGARLSALPRQPGFGDVPNMLAGSL